MARWHPLLLAFAVLLLTNVVAHAKPLPPFTLELEPVESQPLPASVRFVARVESFQVLEKVAFSFILPAGVTTSAQTDWLLDMQPGQPQQFELVLQLERWPAQALGAQLRLINGDGHFTVTDYFLLPQGARAKSGGNHPQDILRQRDGRTIRERAL